MDTYFSPDSGFYNWVLIPSLIFIARILDVSMETLRVVCIAKGYKKLAPLIGFFEILIWVVAISQIMKNLSNVACYISYAAGFSMGSYIGMCLAEKLSLGMVLLRVITAKNAQEIMASLKEYQCNFTSMDGIGQHGQVKVIFTVIPRGEIKKVVNLIKSHNDQAFYSIEEVGFVHSTKIPMVDSWVQPGFLSIFRIFRRGK